MDPDLQELYRLERENNKMLRAMRRNAFWGGIFKVALYLLALGIPIWLYFSYLYPVIKQMDATLTAVTGKKVELEGQFGEWARMLQEFKERFTGATSSTTTAQ
ncbi:hypothetical protein K8R03_02085 [Candidatus Kaiserbacteria bacterium]|nr:hypothetical protein [Candidatus Kaiserbacteria bacterium]